MKLSQFLKTYFLPGTLAAITYDGYRRQVYSHNKDIAQLEEIRINSEKHLELAREELYGQVTVNEDIKLKLSPWNTRINELNVKISEEQAEIFKLNNKILNRDFNNFENVDSLTSYINYHKTMLNKLEADKKIEITGIQNYIDSLRNIKSDIFSWITDLLEQYKIFITSLSLEQLVALTNILGLYMILMTLISITFILLGDYLITHLNLEVRLPKLAKYIKMKEKINKHFLMYYIIIFYILVIGCIIGNFYMFLLKYFV